MSPFFTDLRDRFYTIEGQWLPSVTTILDIIAKPALGPWYAKEERRYFETAMLEVLSRPGARDPEYVLAAVAQAVTGVKAVVLRMGLAVGIPLVVVPLESIMSKWYGEAEQRRHRARAEVRQIPVEDADRLPLGEALRRAADLGAFPTDDLRPGEARQDQVVIGGP